MANIRNGSKKRQSIDPEETGSAAAAPYVVERPNAKRPRTIDDVLGSLSLSSPDPPGNSFCYKRKTDVQVVDDRSAKLAKSSTAEKKNLAENDNSRTNATPESINSDMRQQFHYQHGTSKNITEPGIDDNARGSEDDGQESDSSVSESSIRSAMYQLVFGRRNPPTKSHIASPGDGCGRYSAVDSKIEALIRRSRLEAAIKSQKKDNKENTSTTGMDIGGSDQLTDDGGNYCEWNPGHG